MQYEIRREQVRKVRAESQKASCEAAYSTGKNTQSDPSVPTKSVINPIVMPTYRSESTSFWQAMLLMIKPLAPNDHIKLSTVDASIDDSLPPDTASRVLTLNLC